MLQRWGLSPIITAVGTGVVGMGIVGATGAIEKPPAPNNRRYGRR